MSSEGTLKKASGVSQALFSAFRNKDSFGYGYSMSIFISVSTFLPACSASLSNFSITAS